MRYGSILRNSARKEDQQGQDHPVGGTYVSQVEQLEILHQHVGATCRVRCKQSVAVQSLQTCHDNASACTPNVGEGEAAHNKVGALYVEDVLVCALHDAGAGAWVRTNSKQSK